MPVRGHVDDDDDGDDGYGSDYDDDDFDDVDDDAYNHRSDKIVCDASDAFNRIMISFSTSSQSSSQV